MRQIRELLKPFEYTKIDKIIRVIFSTTQSLETQKEIEPWMEEIVETEIAESKFVRIWNCWMGGDSWPSSRMRH